MIYLAEQNDCNQQSHHFGQREGNPCGIQPPDAGENECGRQQHHQLTHHRNGQTDNTMAQSLHSGDTDNIEAGRKMGEYIADTGKDISAIGIVGHVRGTSTATEREQGLREGLGELEKNVTDVVFCDSDYRKAYHVTKEMLERYPKINVIAGLNEYSSVGAAKAVHDLGLAGQIRMIGFDSSIKEVEYLEDGTFDAIVVQRPLNMGYLCIEKTVQLLSGETVAASVDSGSVLITKETMYTEENQKLLFPF